jgi:hypothetical protein
MSALGQKQTDALQQATSALHPISDRESRHAANGHFRCTPESGHVQCTRPCLLWAKSGHVQCS